MQALGREVVGVIGPLAGGAGPVDEGGAEAGADFLLLLIKALLGHFLPEEAQVAFRGDHPQPDGASGGQQERAGIFIILLALQKLGDGGMRQVTGGENMRQRQAGELPQAAALGKVGLDEGAVPAGEFAKGVQGFDHPGTLRPTAPDPGGQGDDGEFAAGEGGQPGLAELLVQRAGGVEDIRIADILNVGAGGQAVLRQPDAAVFQFVADQFVLLAVKAVLGEQFGEVFPGAIPGFEAGEQAVEERLHHAGQLGARAAGGAELIQLGALGGGQRLGIGAQPAGHVEGVIALGQQGADAAPQLGAGAVLVDGKIINNRLHGEGQRVLKFAPGLRHDGLQTLLRLGLALGIKNEAHAAAGHAAEHPEAPEIAAEFRADGGDEGFGEGVAGPGNDGLQRLVEIARGQPAQGADIAGAQGGQDFIEQTDGLAAAGPFAVGTQQVFFRDHLEDGADVLGHAAVDEHEALLQAGARGGGDVGLGQNLVGRHEAAAADAKLGIAFGRHHAGEAGHAVADRLDLADHGVLGAALDDAPLVFGDRTERAAAEATTHDVDGKADHLPGRDARPGIGRMGRPRIGQGEDAV